MRIGQVRQIFINPVNIPYLSIEECYRQTAALHRYMSITSSKEDNRVYNT